MGNVREEQEAALPKYLERVEQLYAGIVSWCKDWGLDDTRRQTTVQNWLQLEGR